MSTNAIFYLSYDIELTFHSRFAEKRGLFLLSGVVKDVSVRIYVFCILYPHLDYRIYCMVL